MIRRYRVVRPHEGDRFYAENEIREGNEADLKHLVPKVLEPIEEASAKAEPPIETKPEPPAANKEEPGDKETKSGGKKKSA